jgi:transcriptional regulator with XRE-family HTH domain
VGKRGPAKAGPFVEWLGAIIAERRVSWRGLARDAGVSHAALSALRTGKSSQPSMETCYRLAGFLNFDLWHVLSLAGYAVPQRADVDVGDPELDLMFHELLELTPEERESVKQFARFVLAQSAAKRSKRRNADRGASDADC